MQTRLTLKFYILFISLFWGAGAIAQNRPFLKEGFWRGVFHLQENEVPFVFEVKGTNASNATVFLINGKERAALNHIVQKNDSVFIPVELYDAVIIGKVEGNKFNGVFRKLSLSKSNGGLAFTADYGRKARFENKNIAPKASLSGTWDLKMIYPDNTEEVVGLFDQKTNNLTGTILTTTGDYRYFEGTVQGADFYLSAFSGSNPYLIKGKFVNQNEIEAEFITSRGKISIKGVRNAKAALPDPYSLTKLKDGVSSIDFTFPDLNGNPVSLKDPKYKDKVVVISIMGSWCPNCNDEISFLAPWYKKNKERGVEIIGLAFERKKDLASAKATLSLLKKKYGVDYDILFAGQAGTDAASKALPALKAVFSFPTTIFIDKKGNVSRIHTGYNGPATGKFYDEFLEEFNQEIDNLLKQ
ncbi:MAG: TlpA disulfide reductase family protein [Bacteroidota bacterium]|nr:TlpA disulfide reductase family protein [Bacteroidota bacterium]